MRIALLAVALAGLTWAAALDSTASQPSHEERSVVTTVRISQRLDILKRQEKGGGEGGGSGDASNGDRDQNRGEQYPAARTLAAPHRPSVPKKTGVAAPAHPKNTTERLPAPTQASAGPSSVSGLECGLTSTTLAEDAVTAYCYCMDGHKNIQFSRPINTDPKISKNCPATASDSGTTTMAPLVDLRAYMWTSSGYVISCEWGVPNTHPGAAEKTECMGNTSTVSYPVTPTIRITASTGSGIFVGQMTAAALSVNMSSAIVSACTNITACSPATIIGVPYPDEDNPGGFSYGDLKVGFNGAPILENITMLDYMANMTAQSFVQSVKLIAKNCPLQRIQWNNPAAGRGEPALVRSKEEFPVCNVAPGMLVQYYRGDDTHGATAQLWVSVTFTDGKMQPLDVAEELCEEALEAVDFVLAIASIIPVVGPAMAAVGKTVDRVVGAVCSAISAAEEDKSATSGGVAMSAGMASTGERRASPVMAVRMLV